MLENASGTTAFFKALAPVLICAPRLIRLVSAVSAQARGLQSALITAAQRGCPPTYSSSAIARAADT
jgi:hypothetical protein